MQAHKHAASEHHLQAAHLHNLGQHEEAKEHAAAAPEHSELAYKYTTTAHGHSHKRRQEEGIYRDRAEDFIGRN